MLARGMGLLLGLCLGWGLEPAEACARNVMAQEVLFAGKPRIRVKGEEFFVVDPSALRDLVYGKEYDPDGGLNCARVATIGVLAFEETYAEMFGGAWVRHMLKDAEGLNPLALDLALASRKRVERFIKRYRCGWPYPSDPERRCIVVVAGHLVPHKLGWWLTGELDRYAIEVRELAYVEEGSWFSIRQEEFAVVGDFIGQVLGAPRVR